MKASKHIGIWIRVSTELQVKEESRNTTNSVPGIYAQSQGWEVLEIYKLDAVSGKSVMGHLKPSACLQTSEVDTSPACIL